MKFHLLPFILVPLLLACSGISNPPPPPGSISAGLTYSTKQIPEAIRDVALEALSHYPELEHTKIEFRFEDEIVNSFMQAQPKILSLFRSKKNRAYIIKITRHMEIDSNQIAIEEIPHEVLLGWLGHELGHIMDYTHKNGLEMAWFGFRYLTSEKAKIKAERRADIEALKHGMADEIIATKNFILRNASLPEVYKDKIRNYYISPEQVLEIVAELEKEEKDARKEIMKRDSILPAP
jgi:hypothetical protein